MILLSPTLLWFLPLIAIPIIIHILNRRNIQIVEFSSIAFLKKMKHESMKKLRLRQIILLIIRTLLLFFIVMMMIRPVTKGIFSKWVDDPNSTITAIIIDNSFSTTRDVKYKIDLINDITGNLNPESKLIIANTSNQIIYNGNAEYYSEIDESVVNSYSNNTIERTIKLIEFEIEHKFANQELIIITDGQESITENDRIIFEKEWNIFIVKPNQLERNLAISNVKIVNEVLIHNTPIDIEVEITNSGNYDIENSLLQLTIEGINVGQKLVSLQRMSTKHYIFTTVLPAVGLNKGIFKLQNDDRIEDNSYYFNINIPQNRKIALVADNQNELLFITEALNSINRDLLYIDVHSITKDKLFSFNPISHDVVMFVGSSNFDNMFKNIDSFFLNGGKLIYLPNNKSKTYPKLLVELFSIENTAKIIHREPSFQSLKLTNNQFEMENEVNIKMYQYFPIVSSKLSDELILSDESKVWGSAKYLNGVIDISGFAIDLKWTNFPLKGSFIPWIHSSVYTDIFFSNINNIEAETEHSVSLTNKQYSENIYHKPPSEPMKRLVPSDENILTIYQTNEIGNHHIYINDNLINTFTVNIHKKEFILEEYSDNGMKEIFGDNTIIINDISDAVQIIRSSHYGVELWRWILIGFLILLITEMVLSNVRRQRT